MPETLPSIASSLRQWADELDGMTVKLNEPAQEYSIDQAASKLRGLLGKDAFFSIRMELDFHSRGPVIKWQIYDQTATNDKNKFIEAPTLAAAVNAVLAAHAPQPADPISDADTAIRELTEIPF